MEMHSRHERAAGPSPSRAPLIIALAFALLGIAFSLVSTLDFIKHLDREVHSIHCSFIPGANPDAGESGCKAVMLSPYSSFFRTTLWGGIPVALWSLAVFAFLAWRAGWLAWRGNHTRKEALFHLAAWGLPVVMSLIYGYLAMSKVDALCKVCVGIYVASFGGLVAAVWALMNGLRATEQKSGGIWARGMLGGVGFVVALTLVYLIFAPTAKQRACGQLVSDEDSSGIMLSLSPSPGGRPSIEVLDPLCPSCRAFDERLAASGLKERLDLKTVLFPLDSTCNWMVTSSLHPGACAVSEAVLCAGPLSKNGQNADAARAGAQRVLQWAFDNQAELLETAKKSESTLRSRIETEFPEVKGCLGGTVVKNRMVKSLRWAVANALPVLTPQLFVGKSKMCVEDTDLGLEYALNQLLKQ